MADETNNKSKQEDEMSPEERLTWLRDHGVIVETPEERKAKAVREIVNEPDGPISYVLVPADTSRPLQELSFTPDPTVAGDAFLQHLKKAFSGDKGVDLTLFQETAAKHFAGTDAPEVSQEALKQVAEKGSVETFTLVHGIPSNRFTAIHIYLDEVGMLKRLPLNSRAGDYARRAGFEPPPQFHGDVYLARVQTKPRIRHLPFVLGEDTDLKADWLQRATAENLEYQLELNRITGRNDVQKGVDGSDGIAKDEQGYSWTQTEEELEVVVPLPSDAGSKDLNVKYRPQELQVVCRKEPLVLLELFERIDPDGSTWTLDQDGDKQKLVVTMEKVEQALWPRIRN